MKKQIIVKDTTIARFRKEVETLRGQIENYLISLLEAHDTDSVDCYVCEGCPVIIDGVSFDSDYSTYTLDTINLYIGNNGKYISFDCSNNCSGDTIDLEDLNIERLIEVCEWVQANEDELFEVED